MLRALSLAALMLLPGLATAQDLLGTISASVDGTEMSWYLTAEGGESQSGARATMGVPMVDISLWGNPAPDQLATLKGALVIDFKAVTTGGARAMTPEIQYLEDGYAGAWIALTDDVVSVSLTSFDKTDSAVTLAGSFEATAAFTDDMATMQTDPTRTRVITGSFEATLPLQ